MEDRGKRFEDKLDKVVDKISSIDVTLASQHVSLEHHIRRTDLLEAEIRPLKKNMAMAEGALKLLGASAVIVALIEGIRTLIR